MRRRQPPENELPVSVAVDAVLGETADLVVYTSDVRVFRTVLEFRLTALGRHRGTGRGLGGGLFGHGEQDDRLLLGVEYADGRHGSNLGGFRTGSDPDLDPNAPVLMPGGGSGGDRAVDMSFYLTPLPPLGCVSYGTSSQTNRPLHRRHQPFRRAAGSTAIESDPVGDP